MGSTKETILEKGDAITATDNSRSWGTVSCIGTAYGKVVVNFNPSNNSQYQTVIVPENLQEFALIALREKLSVLATFSGPLAPYVSVTDLLIYN
ncbi:hypothetical protein [Flavobacterium marginilacus]|uniref:hypothetical protein n=1 Tax=Flavobacterium marginilacus TaxID=3003256 RepID=UPI00248E74AF|nr:hypothetical protein [Flavobacterium marginilacus]